MARMGNLLKSGLLPILAASLVLVGCELSGGSAGTEDPGNRGRTASAGFSTITGSGGTSTVGASVIVTLQSSEGFPLFNVVPEFTVTPLSTNDFGFTCTATDAFGTSTCTFRSFDAGVAKTLLLTSPVSATGNAITFTQSGSQLVTTTEPNTGHPTTGIVPTAAEFATQAVLEIRDPLNVLVAGDSSTAVTATLNTVSAVNTTTPTLFKNDVACAAPCQITAAAGIANFGTAGNQLSTNIAGNFTFTFSATDMTSVTSSQFTTRAGVGSTISFTTQPSTSVASLTTFAQAPIVTIKDANGNIVTDDPNAGAADDSTANVTLTLTHPTDTTASLLGNRVKRSNSGVADYSEQGLRVDSEVPATGLTLTASATLDAGAVNATSNAFELTSVGIPTKLAFTTQPSTITTTATVLPQQPVVAIQDADGNTVTTENTRVVQLDVVTPTDTNCDDAPIGTAGDNTITLINGVATFGDLQMIRDGTAGCDFYQLTASVVGDATISSTSSENVLVGEAGVVPQQLAFSVQPTTAGVGQTMTSFTVQVQDAAGNLIANDNSTVVTLSITTGDGSLGGTFSKTATAGAAIFDAVTISTTGAKILTASANTLTSAASNAFFIDTSGTATGLKFTQIPTSETAGVNFGVGNNAIVQVIDDAGSNVALGGITVTLSCTNPTGCNLVGANLSAITDTTGLATFATDMLITTPVGNNFELTATATTVPDTTLTIGTGSSSILGTLTIAAGAANDFNSSIAASAPTAINNPNGVVTVVLQDEFGNGINNTTPTVSFAASAGSCTGSCGATTTVGGVNGVATCSYSCTTSGAIVTIGITNPAGLTKTAVIGVP